ncbi:MAG: hypothetical protein IMZ52_10155 [Actinobacteria bacterium]|nr:hypothetical protein [Actinomycetota bacterium]MBE3122571.1 hypothetical protein [Thermoplasmata archaeon]
MNSDKVIGIFNLVVGMLLFITFFLSWQFNIGTEKDLIFFGIASVINLEFGLYILCILGTVGLLAGIWHYHNKQHDSSQTDPKKAKETKS